MRPANAIPAPSDNPCPSEPVAALPGLAALAGAALTLGGTDWAQVRFAELPALYGRLPALLRALTDGRAFNPRVMGMALAMLFPACLALALWSGDNECDCGYVGWWGPRRDPATNRLTREVLAEVVEDSALADAIRQGQDSELVDRDAVFRILDSKP